MIHLSQDPDAGKDWGQKEKGETEDEMVGWHHRVNDMNSSKLWEMVKDGEAWCSWGCKELDRLSNCTVITSLSQEDRSILDTRACICSKNGFLCAVYFWVSVWKYIFLSLPTLENIQRWRNWSPRKIMTCPRSQLTYSGKNKTRTQNSSYNIKINYRLEKKEKKKAKEILIFFSSNQWISTKKVNPELAI